MIEMAFGLSSTSNRIRLIALTIQVACIAVAMSAPSSEQFYAANFPGVTIGLDSRSVMAQRPRAFRSNTSLTGGGQVNDSNFDLIEIINENGQRIVFWYYVRDATVAGMCRGVPSTGLPLESARAQARNVRSTLQSAFDFKRIDKILRSTGVETALLSAELWGEKNGTLRLYFLASNQDITVIVFDPQRMSKKDFFLGPERLKEFQDQ